MLRTVLRPTALLARSLRQPAVAAWRRQAPAAISARAFAAAVKKPKHEDPSLEGRYATALFMASADRIDKINTDLLALQTMMQESKEFKTLIESPGIDPKAKVDVLTSVCKKLGADGAVVNFLKVLIENKRIGNLNKIIDLYQTFYRAEKGLILCKVTSASALSASQQAEVKKAMEARAAKGSTLIMEYDTNSALLGGLVVKMGEAVMDFSVNTRLERLQTQLLAPLA